MLWTNYSFRSRCSKKKKKKSRLLFFPSPSLLFSSSCPPPSRKTKGLKKRNGRFLFFLFPNETSGPRLDDDGPVRPARPVDQPDVGHTESEVPGLRVTQIPVHGFEHHGEPRPRGARIRAELRQLLPDARRVAEHPLLPAVRESVPEFGEWRAESGGGQLQREAGGSETGQQRVEALLRSGTRGTTFVRENFSPRKIVDDR